MKYWLACVVAIAGCSSESEPTRRVGPSPQALLTGTSPKQRKNCPSAVVSAVTTSRPTPDGVELTITSRDPRAAREIVQRTAKQVVWGDPITMFPEHSGLHGGPGTIGFCPLIHANTTMSYEPIPGGVRVRVSARDAREISALQRATETRVRAIRVPAA